ncbi:MAG: SNF2-related protein [Kiritimatiellia bacterium]|jgi:SNF2 family DNA or RNA helicase
MSGQFKLTERQIKAWGGEQLYNEALEQYCRKGGVLSAKYEEPYGEAVLRYASHVLKTRFKVYKSGLVENLCPCSISQNEGRVCIHIVAAAIRLNRIAQGKARTAEKEQERQIAERVSQAVKQGLVVTRDYAKGHPAEIRLRVRESWHDDFVAGEIPLTCTALMPGGGNPVSLDYIAQRRIPLKPGPVDDTMLFVLEDIQSGDMTKPVVLTKADFVGILAMLGAQDRPLYRSGGNPFRIERTPVVSKLMIDMDRDTGEILLILTTDVPGAPEGADLKYVVFGSKGYVFHDGVFWPLESVLPGHYQKVYFETVAIPRKGTLGFFKNEIDVLRQQIELREEIDRDLFTMQAGIPELSLKVKGSPASISMTLFAQYDDVDVVAGANDPRGDFALPDEHDFYLYTVRNIEYERHALDRLRTLGIPAETGNKIDTLVGERAVLNFLGTQVHVLRRAGWKVFLDSELGDYNQRLERAIPIVEVEQTRGANSFEIGYTFQGIHGRPIPPAEIFRAISMRDSFIKRGDEAIIFDMDAVKSLHDVLQDCNSVAGSRPGFVRVSNVHAPYIKASIDDLDGEMLRAKYRSAEWRDYADNHNRKTKLEPVALEEPLRSILRPYQKEGLSWLRFLEANRLGGILADEMGLGKTLQALTWLSLPRIHAEYAGHPAIVVCPTSLVDNWAHEAKHFIPDMRVLTMAGAQRHENFDRFDDYDLVITSYALLRRDIETYRHRMFSAIVLDEAQNIKNRATQNATSVKQLRGGAHLVLTGTPMENSVADLWSIMDFLMPGYLGHYDEFRANYEIPLSVPGDDLYESAQIRLRRKLHPFLLRRKKIDVAKDLPPKISKLSWSRLSPDQQAVYDQILYASRMEIRQSVQRDGFNKSRMAILAALLRLRQVCCHLGLLADVNPAAAKAAEPSAKMEQFFDIFDEATGQGHRILVFSQFVKMLGLIRDELDKRDIRYCYLDGASKDRMESVHKFNTDPTIPLFLISLKAGGTGLNLTGADTVIHFDPWWNPAVEDQATDRAHRIGQKKTVYCLKMITADTVEEKVLDMQRRKRAIIGATVESDEQTIAKLTWDDVRELFDL